MGSLQSMSPSVDEPLPPIDEAPSASPVSDAGDAQLVASALAIRKLSLHNPDLLRHALDSLETRLRTHAFGGMSAEDLALLIVTLKSLPGLLAGGVLDKLQAALAKRLEDFDPAASICLAQGDLNGALPVIQKILVRRFLDDITPAVRSLSPGAIASAVESAKQAFADFETLDPALRGSPQADREQRLENLMSKALEPNRLKLRALEQVFAGGKIDPGGRIAEQAPNAVSQALNAQTKNLSPADQLEAANLKLFRRAVGHAFRPPVWREPPGEVSAADLFNQAGPTLKFREYQAQLGATRPLNADHLQVLETVDGIALEISQPQAEELITLLNALARRLDLGEHLGAVTTPYRWSAAQLKYMLPAQRSEQLRAMFASATTQVRQRLTVELNSKLAQVENRTKTRERSREAFAEGKRVQHQLPKYLVGTVSHSAPGELIVKDPKND